MTQLTYSLRTYSLQALKRMPLLLLSLWIVFEVELLSRGAWSDAFGWTFKALPELLLNTFVVLGLLLLFTAATASIRLSFWLVATFCLAFGLISGIKLEILGVPFLPWDLALTSETKDMAQYLSGLVNFTVISGFITFIAVSLVLLYKLPRMNVKFHWKHRLLMGAASGLLLISVYNDEGSVSLKAWANVQNLAWDQTENVKTNGFLLSTIMNLKFLSFEEPGEYNKDKIRAIVTSTKPVVDAPGEVKPNVIVVLSESFWDMTQAEHLSFSRDPLPFYHSLTEKFTSGTMLSPQYGGGTANVEFEVLTGNTMRFLPQGSVPYNQYIDKEVDSLASILRRQGYATTAINPFHSWFYNSKKVYRNLGFSQYISQEFFEEDYEGPYIADRAVAKYIIESGEKTQGPDFIFANTMQNHYHYYPGKFEENTIEVTGAKGDSQGLLETYAQGLLGADDMLKRLVEHYERSGEPTILVFFGDHLPSLGDNYQAYKDSGYLEENDPEFLNKMYRVPVLVWNNYLPEHRDVLDLSPSFLGPYLLHLAERPGSAFTDYLYELSRKMPVLPPENLYSAMGISEDMLTNYKLLQYDNLFGNKYAYDAIKDTIVDPNFVLGLGDLAIENVVFERSEDAPVAVVRGRNLPYHSIVEINGKPVEAEWESTGELRVALPDGIASEPRDASLKLQVKVKDSKDIVVARSNEFVYKGAY